MTNNKTNEPTGDAEQRRQNLKEIITSSRFNTTLKLDLIEKQFQVTQPVNGELREMVVKELTGSSHIDYASLVEYAKQNGLDADRLKSVDAIMVAFAAYLQAAVAEARIDEVRRINLRAPTNNGPAVPLGNYIEWRLQQLTQSNNNPTGEKQHGQL